MISPAHFQKHFRGVIEGRLAEAAHVGVGGDGLILGHLVTHLSEGLPLKYVPGKDATK